MALPSRPSPRSRPGARPPRQYDYDDYDRPPQPRSAPTQFRERAPPPSHQSLRSNRNAGYGGDPDGSSRSSQASSFMRPSGSSSRTSMDDDYDYQNQKQTQDHAQQPVAEESNLWNRVASAAGALTVNVGKAWSANVTLEAGEITPPGKESRITKGLRAYHLQKARDPSELPSWLFDEAERKPVARATTASRYNNNDAYDEPPQEPAPRSRGLRDMYESAGNTRGDYAAQSSRGGGGYADEPPSSRAADRLKALRDAKRGVPSRRADPEPEPVEEEPVYSTRRMMPPARQGLPGRPRRA